MIALKIIAAVIVLQIICVLFIAGACHKPTPDTTDYSQKDKDATNKSQVATNLSNPEEAV